MFYFKNNFIDPSFSKYNTSLSMVTLLCPAVKTPKLSKFMEAVLDGGDIHDWLVPESEEQVRITDPLNLRSFVMLADLVGR